MKPSNDELDQAALRDLLSDAESCEKQAVSGPFYPERGITAENLLAWAAKYREQAKKYAEGGAHSALIGKRDD